MKRKIDTIGTSALVGAVVCWSTVPLFLKYFTGYIDGWTANGLRYPFAALLYIPWLISFWRKGVLSARMWKLALVPAGINMVSQVLWAWTPYFIDPGLMAFLVRLSTVWTVIGSFLLFADERSLLKSPLFWSGFILAMGGFVAMILGGPSTFGRATVIGIIMVVLTSIGWAGYQLSVRRNMQHIDSRAAFGMISLITSAGLVLGMFSFGQPQQALQMPASVSVLVLLSGLVGIAMAHLLFYIALKRVGVAIASSTNLVSAFITALFSRLLFHEVLTWTQWMAGMALVVGGILLTRAQIHIHSAR